MNLSIHVRRQRVVRDAAAILFGLGLSVAVLATDLPDPMRPPTAAAAPAAKRPSPVPTRVTALFLSSDRRAAVVDGKLVREGDRSGLCQVEAILDVGVRCRFPKGTRVVRLPLTEHSIKKPTASAVVANGVP